MINYGFENSTNVMTQLQEDQNVELAEALLCALARAKTLDGYSLPIMIPFGVIPSVCRELRKSLEKLGIKND